METLSKFTSKLSSCALLKIAIKKQDIKSNFFKIYKCERNLEIHSHLFNNQNHVQSKPCLYLHTSGVDGFVFFGFATVVADIYA